MSEYELRAFGDYYQRWIVKEGPSVQWQIRVVDWLQTLDASVFDEAIHCLWRGKNAWTARICDPAITDVVVVCTFNVHNAEKFAHCRQLYFAPFYDIDPDITA